METVIVKVQRAINKKLLILIYDEGQRHIQQRVDPAVADRMEKAGIFKEFRFATWDGGTWNLGAVAPNQGW